MVCSVRRRERSAAEVGPRDGIRRVLAKFGVGCLVRRRTWSCLEGIAERGAYGRVGNIEAVQ